MPRKRFRLPDFALGYGAPGSPKSQAANIGSTLPWTLSQPSDRQLQPSQVHCQHNWICDPKVLLQGPETSKVPKVVRRGCKRCFGPKEQRSPKSLLHHQNPVLHRCNSLLHQCKRTLAPLAQKTFCTLS